MELIERIRQTARDDPARPAYVDAASGDVLDYAKLAAQIDDSGMRGPVALRCSNVPAFATMLLGCLVHDADVLIVPCGTPALELHALATRCDSGAIFADGLEPTPEFPETLSIETGSLGLAGRPATGAFASIVLPTSGSTGAPKLARRSARSLDAVAANCVEAVGLRPRDRVLATVPLAHSYGLEHGLLAPLWAGATVLLCQGLDLDALARVSAGGADVFPAVPAAIERLADAREVVPGLRGLRACYSAGAPLPDDVRERFAARYADVGQLYGSTEIGSVTYRAAGEGSGVGWRMSGVEARTLGDGELAIRAPSMFAGYVDEPAELVDGFFRTGDLGSTAADGCIELTGRVRLLIDVGGAKVNPLEVEAVLQQHPAVALAVVVPLRQSATVCRLRAVVVRRGEVGADEVRAFARERLAPHKVPRVVEFCAAEDVPRSPTGKVLRHMLGSAEGGG